MDITIVEHPRTTAFTTLARMRRELGISPTDTSKDERLTDLIEEASADVVAFCRQPLIRQTVIERQAGNGRNVQVLSVTPIPQAGVIAVRLRGTTLSGRFSVSNPDAGFIFYENRFDNTGLWDQWIERDPSIMAGFPDYEFEYSGGYILPGDDIVSEGTCTANLADSSFELTGSDTFPIMVSGESIVVTGFDAASNNGRFTVIERTRTKLYVSTTLTQETPSGITTIACRNLPRDIESATILEAKTRFITQFRDPTLKSESLGDWSASYGAPSSDKIGESLGGLNALTASRLDRYVRIE